MNWQEKVPIEYEKVISLADHSSFLKGFIAIHNTKLGPALGGTRLFAYRKESEALDDVLALAKAMTYKCAISGLPFGGGKGVIIEKSGYPKSKDAILREYASIVDSLKGKFYTGEDVGLTEADVQKMFKYSLYFVGRSGQAGDPSWFAAYSVYRCMKRAVKQIFGRSNISGLKVAVKGLGKTGSALVDLLIKEKVEIFAADIDSARVELIRKKYPAIQIVSPKTILFEEVDIVSPCALGQEISKSNVNFIRARIIAGTANNQLDKEEVADLLLERAILYVPDFVANAGGLIDVADELLKGGYSEKRVLRNIDKLEKTCDLIFTRSKTERRSPNVIAKELARANFIEQQAQHES